MAVKEDLRLGLVGPSLARQLTRLPVGNQEALLALTRRETLTAQEVSGVIDLLQGASQDQVAFVLAKPREALVHGMPTALRDPRLSRAGNWLARHLAQALEAQDLAIARSQLTFIRRAACSPRFPSLPAPRMRSSVRSSRMVKKVSRPVTAE